MGINETLRDIKEYRMLDEINFLNQEGKRLRAEGSLKFWDYEIKVMNLFNKINEELKPFNKRITIDRPILVEGTSLITNNYNYIIVDIENNTDNG